MKTIVFFLEEPSAREMLESVLPRILPTGTSVFYAVFQGKQDLEKNLIKRLRGWRLPDSVFVVMRDQDSGDCFAIKRRLVELCAQAGRGDALIRIACRELESFYLGDLEAVEKGLGLGGIASLENNRKYRNPDGLYKPSIEMHRLTSGIYQKVSGSRAIAPFLSLEANRSNSFKTLLSGIRRLIDAAC